MSNHTATLLWNMAVAIRRLLIVVDKERPAAKFAAGVLAQADAALMRR